MRDALARDLADIAEVTFATTHDARVAAPAWGKSRPVAPGDDPWAIWAERLREADVFWPVAPETGGALARLHALGRAAGVAIVGPDEDAIRIASSKTMTAERLMAAGIATPPCWTADDLPDMAQGPFVSKPDDGAGCEATRFWPHRPPAGAVPIEHVLQPFVEGEAASLSLLRRDGVTTVLAANRQRVVVEDGVFVFHGLVVNALDRADPELQALAVAVCAALPGLDGLFGLDVVLSREGPVAIDVNPRVTTSYVGLREALGFNPLRLVAPFADREPSAAQRNRAAVEIPL